MLVGPSEELRLGAQASREILKKETECHDPRYTEPVRRVGMRIARVANRPDYQWEFHVIDKPKVVNAFCLPGGKIFVYTGIFKYIASDAELATVIGHETGHALARHGAERMSMALLAQLGEAAGATALNLQTEEAIKAFDAAYGLAANVGLLLPYSRTQEYEADHIGLILMALAGYDPHAALSFWSKMAQESKGKAAVEFLSTHPLDANRIARIRALIPEAMRYYRPQPSEQHRGDSGVSPLSRHASQNLRHVQTYHARRHSVKGYQHFPDGHLPMNVKPDPILTIHRQNRTLTD